jgi:Tol biopolymer transport system component
MNCLNRRRFSERARSTAGQASSGTHSGVFLYLAAILFIAGSAFAAEPVKVTTDGRVKRDPVFIAGSKQLVYVALETPVLMRLMKHDMQTGKSVAMHPDATKSEFEPAFSPDGKFYAFVQSRGNLSLALVIHDTVNDSMAEIKPSGGFSGMRSPAISPDGKRVLYCYPAERRQVIFSVDTKAGNQRVLSDSPDIDNWPDYSPDGKRIVFGSTRDGNYEIYMMFANGSNVRRLTDSPRQDIRPAFSPDGRRIAFVSVRDGNHEIYVMNTDGSGVTRVTKHPERDDYPAWHPDGKRLVIVSERRGRHDLYLIDVPR